MFNEKSHFFDIERAQIEPILVTIFDLIALLFVPFHLYPLHASKAGAQQNAAIMCIIVTSAFLGRLL